MVERSAVGCEGRHRFGQGEENMQRWSRRWHKCATDMVGLLAAVVTPPAAAQLAMLGAATLEEYIDRGQFAAGAVCE
ncbi:hypothetical protein GCM10011393_25190 [Sphingopyxis bauzanensis]|nr:hypothetical protein GCM10011393_25190 [Sphingopyxis bauzanensis]